MDFTGQDIIDVRDLIARFEELESLKDNAGGTFNEPYTAEDAEELKALQALLSDLKGNGGDEQWRGDWYPVSLIREDYFVDYCQELLEDIGDIPKGLPGYIVIDWEATAENLKADYSTVDFDGQTYYYR
jgi:antirestriction protein